MLHMQCSGRNVHVNNIEKDFQWHLHLVRQNDSSQRLLPECQHGLVPLPCVLQHKTFLQVQRLTPIPLTLFPQYSRARATNKRQKLQKETQPTELPPGSKQVYLPAVSARPLKPHIATNVARSTQLKPSIR